jgi:hypothetical protein
VSFDIYRRGLDSRERPIGLAETVERLLDEAEAKHGRPMRVVLNGVGEPVAAVSREPGDPVCGVLNRKAARALRARARSRS